MLGSEQEYLIREQVTYSHTGTEQCSTVAVPMWEVRADI